MNKGKAYLVGAGPGDPGLLTVRAAQLLHLCDVLIYDVLVIVTIVSNLTLHIEKYMWVKEGAQWNRRR